MSFLGTRVKGSESSLQFTTIPSSGMSRTQMAQTVAEVWQYLQPQFPPFLDRGQARVTFSRRPWPRKNQQKQLIEGACGVGRRRTGYKTGKPQRIEPFAKFHPGWSAQGFIAAVFVRRADVSFGSATACRPSRKLWSATE